MTQHDEPMRFRGTTLVAFLSGFVFSLATLAALLIVGALLSEPWRLEVQPVWGVAERNWQIVLLSLFCAPAALGAVVAGALAPRHPWWASLAVVSIYLTLIVAPLVEQDDVAYPLGGVVGLDAWLVVATVAVWLVVVPLAGVAAIRTTRHRGMSAE